MCTKTATLEQREATVYCAVLPDGKVIHQCLSQSKAEAYIRSYNNLVLGIKPEPPQILPLSPIDDEHQKVVSHLQQLSGNVLEVSFEPNVFIEGDEEIMGHLYSAGLQIGNEENYLYMDDRSPEPLENQLVKELGRVASVYSDLAQTVRLNATDKPVYRVDVTKDGEVVECLCRTDNKRSAEITMTSFNEVINTDGPKIEAKICVE